MSLTSSSHSREQSESQREREHTGVGGNPERLITEHLDVWSSAIKRRGSQGRGSSKKIELYGITKLRELILELAMKGSLLPQETNDEPSSVTLEKIASLKKQLLQAKKIKKAKNAPASEMPRIPFSTPEGWSLPILSDLIVNSSDDIVDGPFGSKLKATEYVDEGVPIVRIQNVGRNEFKENGLQYLTEDKAESLERHAFFAGDIVLNKLGEPTGKVCIVPDSIPKGIIVADIIRVRIDEELINKQFLVHCMNSPFVALQFSGLAKGVTRQRVNLSQVRSLEIPLPPLVEQARIVAKVDELMALCDQLEQQQESSISAHQTLVETLLAALTNAGEKGELTAMDGGNAGKAGAFSGQSAWARIAEHFDTLFTTEHSIDQLKQTILQLAVMGKLVPQDPNDEPASVLLNKIADEKERLVKEVKIKKQKKLPPISEEEKPFELPEGWEWCRLQDAIDVRDGTHDSPKDAVGGNTYPLITSKNFKNGEIDFEGARQISEEDHYEICKRSFVEVDDILFSMIGGNIGNQVMVKDPRPFSIKNVALFKYYSKSATCPSFFKVFTEELAIELQEKASGGAQPFVSLGALRKLVFALPPYNEQESIVKKIDALTAICDSLKANIRLSQTTQLHLADAMAEQALK